MNVCNRDTLTTIATGLAASINADSNLAAVGVTATAVSTVVNIKSTSTNNTTYAKSTSGGATETIVLAPASSATQYGYNNVNEMTSIAAGGGTLFQATTNKALKSATINGSAATLQWAESFSGQPSLSSGSNTVPVSATDGAGTVKTNNYQINLAGPTSATPTHDANGNMTSDGTNSYSWDAENRLIKITYPGTGNYSQFSYDAFSGLVGIVETVSSAVTSTKQFVRCGSQMCEERNASSTITKQFFGWGQALSGSNYYYCRNHLGSITDVVDSSGNVVAHYEYGMYGEVSQTVGTLSADFGYAGYYVHGPSGLNLTTYRAYSPSLGRWISRDPIEEDGGDNLYEYADNDPIGNTDPSGYSCNATYKCCTDAACCDAMLAICLACHPGGSNCCYTREVICRNTVANGKTYPGTATWADCGKPKYQNKKPPKGPRPGVGPGRPIFVPNIPIIIIPISPDPESPWYPGHYGVGGGGKVSS